MALHDRPGCCVVSIKQPEFKGLVELGMGEVEVVTDDHSGGPALDEGRELLRVGAEMYMNHERLSGSGVEAKSFLWRMLRVLWTRHGRWGLEEDGFLSCTVVKDEHESLLIDPGVCSAQPGESEDKGGSSVEFGD